MNLYRSAFHVGLVGLKWSMGDRDKSDNTKEIKNTLHEKV